MVQTQSRTKVSSDVFEIYPALDVQDGKLARSPESRFQTIAEALGAYEIPGITWLHLVDLDLAYNRGSNTETIAQVMSDTSLKVQLSGGIKTVDLFKAALEFRPSRINLAPDFLLQKVDLAVVLGNTDVEVSCAIDLEDNQLVSRATGAHFGPIEPHLAWLEEHGCQQIVLTEAKRDGKLEGVNIDLYKHMRELTGMRIVASGGVSSMTDIQALANSGVAGVIVGTALHHGTINLSEVVAELGLQ